MFSSETVLKIPGAVPLHVIKMYFDQTSNKYILNVPNFPIGKMVTDHYTIGKKEPAYYLQAGDDFYMIGDKNPLHLNHKIPVLSGMGELKVRFSIRSKQYEIQAEIKLKSIDKHSDFSVAPNTKKQNPFA